MLRLKPCNRKNLCIDCDNTNCLHAGDYGADCPFWICQVPGTKCSRCKLRKQIIKQLKEE